MAKVTSLIRPLTRLVAPVSSVICLIGFLHSDEVHGLWSTLLFVSLFIWVLAYTIPIIPDLESEPEPHPNDPHAHIPEPQPQPGYVGPKWVAYVFFGIYGMMVFYLFQLAIQKS